MKVLLLVLVLVLAGTGSYFFYFKDHPITLLQGPESGSPPPGPGAGSSKRFSPATPAPDAKKGFKDLTVRLQATMDHVPVDLRETRQLPVFALDTKARVAQYLGLHAEYVTLTQACDLIIDADQEFEAHQEKCGLAPVPATASPQERAKILSTQTPGALQQHQNVWNTQRLQADSKVRQLLATLEDRRL